MVVSFMADPSQTCPRHAGKGESPTALDDSAERTAHRAVSRGLICIFLTRPTRVTRPIYVYPSYMFLLAILGRNQRLLMRFQSVTR